MSIHLQTQETSESKLCLSTSSSSYPLKSAKATTGTRLVGKVSDAVIFRSVPVETNDSSLIVDDVYYKTKEKFRREMVKMDLEIEQFSDNLMALTNQSMPQEALERTWENLIKSPLIQMNGDDMFLQLHFDLRGFRMEEISVKIANDMLKVIAKHEEKTENTKVYREYRKNFVLPKGTDPRHVVSSLSKDGVLIVKAKLEDLVTGYMEERDVIQSVQFTQLHEILNPEAQHPQQPSVHGPITTNPLTKQHDK